MGLSAGSFHAGSVELFTARRLQAFQRWVEELRGEERGK